MSQLDPTATRRPAPPGDPTRERSLAGPRGAVLWVVLSMLFLALGVLPSAWAQSPPELVSEAETLFTVVASGQPPVDAVQTQTAAAARAQCRKRVSRVSCRLVCVVPGRCGPPDWRACWWR